MKFEPIDSTSTRNTRPPSVYEIQCSTAQHKSGPSPLLTKTFDSISRSCACRSSHRVDSRLLGDYPEMGLWEAERGFWPIGRNPKIKCGALMSCSSSAFPCYLSCYFPAHSLFRFQAGTRLLQCLRAIGANRPPSAGKNSLYFSLLSGICPRDGFAGDCILRQTVCSSENLSLNFPQKALFWAFSVHILAGKPRCRRCSAQFIEGRDVILARVKFGGWRPSRIASTMSGARKAQRMITLM
jgi:hypothetical protein